MEPRARVLCGHRVMLMTAYTTADPATEMLTPFCFLSADFDHRQGMPNSAFDYGHSHHITTPCNSLPRCGLKRIITHTYRRGSHTLTGIPPRMMHDHRFLWWLHNQPPSNWSMQCWMTTSQVHMHRKRGHPLAL